MDYDIDSYNTWQITNSLFVGTGDALGGPWAHSGRRWIQNCCSYSYSFSYSYSYSYSYILYYILYTLCSIDYTPYSIIITPYSIVYTPYSILYSIVYALHPPPQNFILKNEILDPGDQHPGSWIQHPGSWIQHPGSGFRISFFQMKFWRSLHLCVGGPSISIFIFILAFVITFSFLFLF